jgi:hypothetical protein
MELFFCKRKLKNEGKKWVITTINDLILKCMWHNTVCNVSFQTIRMTYFFIDVVNSWIHKCEYFSKNEILEQQITTSKFEGIHNCADRTDKFVSN